MIWLKAFALTVSVNKGLWKWTCRHNKRCCQFRPVTPDTTQIYLFRWFIIYLAIKQIRLHMLKTHTNTHTHTCTCTHLHRRRLINHQTKKTFFFCALFIISNINQLWSVSLYYNYDNQRSFVYNFELYGVEFVRGFHNLESELLKDLHARLTHN